MKVVAVIPALDERATIGGVVEGIRSYVDAVIVVDNGSTDGTGDLARTAGAVVVVEPRRGYGAACLAGVANARRLGADVVLFLDADGSDDPHEAPKLLAPIRDDAADLVLGVRTRVERGAMAPVQRFGNWLAPILMRVATGARYSDMPPFKAVTMTALDRLDLHDAGMGYIIEMLMKAHAARLRVREVDVTCHVRRGGASKISGTLIGTVRASAKIVTTIARYTRRHARD